MKTKFTFILLSLLCFGQAVYAQSNKDKNPPTDNGNGRENWFPNRGNVGIGTRKPSESLEVIGNVRVSSTLFTTKLETVGLKATSLSVSDNAFVGKNLIVGGNIGINVSNPTQRLEINGNLKVVNIYAANGTYTGFLKVEKDITTNSKIGIGVITPLEKLEVAGNIKATRNLFAYGINVGDGVFSRNVGITGNASVTGNASITGALSAGSLTTNSGTITNLTTTSLNSATGIFTGTVNVAGNFTATGITASTGAFSGNLSAQSLQINNGTVAANYSVLGNLGIGSAAGTEKLKVTGSAYVNGLLTTENLTVKQKLDLKGTFSVAGSLAVGISTPSAMLHVGGDGKFDGDLTANKITVKSIEIAGQSSTGQPSSSLTLQDMFATGSVGIGTTKTEGYKLSVNGKIRASDIIKVYPEGQWSDFVFETDYKLRSLDEVDKYIKKNKHLPEIPSAKEVAKNGIELGGMDAKLLMKIEELTLYVIDMNKLVSDLKKENDLLRKEISSIKTSQKR